MAQRSEDGVGKTSEMSMRLERAVALADLFDGRSQLIIYEFMFAPGVSGWPAAGYPMCSFLSDHIDPTLPHLEHHDVSLVVVSQGPRKAFEPCRERMGWHFKWVSSGGGEFGRDYQVSFTQEDLDAGRNTITTVPARRPNPARRPASACSSRTPAARSSTPTRPTPAEATC